MDIGLVLNLIIQNGEMTKVYFLYFPCIHLILNKITKKIPCIHLMLNKITKKITCMVSIKVPGENRSSIYWIYVEN